MAKINENSLRNWNNGETMTEADYEQERSIIVTAHNDTDTRVDNLDTGSNNHKTAPVLDHPNGSVTRDKIANGAVNLSKADTADFDTRYYTESEIDGKIATINTRNTADENALSSHKTSGDHDGRYYTETEVDTKLSSKADVSSVYTKTQLDGGQLDSRYFTESEVNSLLESNRTGNHAGTWQGLTPEGLGSESINGSRITAIEQKLSSASVLPVTLKRGWNYFSANEPSPLNVTVQGRTLVNDFGKDGNFETDSNADGAADGWIKSATGTFSLENGSIYGGKVQRIDSLAGDGYTERYIRKFAKFEAGKKYVIVVDLVTDSISHGKIRVTYNNGVSLALSMSTTSKVLYVKFSPTTTGNSETIDLMNENSLGVTGYVKFDGACLYEITDNSLWDAIGTTITESNIRNYLSYVDSVKHLSGVYLTKPGKNLLPPFTEWTLHANAVVTEPYKLTLNATATGQITYVRPPVLPSTQYTLTVPDNAYIDIAYISNTGANVYKFTRGVPGPYTFTTESNTAYVQVSIYAPSAGTFVFTNPQLELGSVATAFEPRNDDAMLINTTLAGINGVYDTFDSRTGRVLRRWMDITLDGSLPWAFVADYSGFKQVSTNTFTFPITGNSGKTSKYDGKVLPNFSGTPTGSDQTAISQGTGQFHLSIADADSGWGESYTPTADEIKAYFYGWKMYDQSTNFDGTGTYNGTGTKGWAQRNLDGTFVNGTPVLPTTSGWISLKPYRLTYQLSKPVDEPAPIEGSISLHVGGNQVEYGEGMIVREKVIPAFTGSDYFINGALGGAGKLASRTKQILAIYRNGIVDKKWGIGSTAVQDIPTYGLQQAAIGGSLYDPGAEYTATYIALDKYAMTANVTDASAEYQGNIEMLLRELTKRQTDISEAVSILQSTKANRGQGQWLPITLLNGWTHEGNNTTLPAYRKNEFGEIEIKGGIYNGTITSGVVLFVLPSGYRPKEILRFSLPNWDYTPTLYDAAVEINLSGQVVLLKAGTNLHLVLDGIKFYVV